MIEDYLEDIERYIDLLNIQYVGTYVGLTKNDIPSRCNSAFKETLFPILLADSTSVTMLVFIRPRSYFYILFGEFLHTVVLLIGYTDCWEKYAHQNSQIIENNNKVILKVISTHLANELNFGFAFAISSLLVLQPLLQPDKCLYRPNTIFHIFFLLKNFQGRQLLSF